MTTLRLKPVKKSVPVEMELEDGSVLLYSVREFTGSQREAFFEKQSKKIVTGPEGEVKEVKDYKGMYSTLLSYTVHDPDGKLVPEATIQEWPDSVQKALLAVAQEVCNMGDKAEDKEPKKS